MGLRVFSTTDAKMAANIACVVVSESVNIKPIRNEKARHQARLFTSLSGLIVSASLGVEA